jgi:hypothetical protein
MAVAKRVLQDRRNISRSITMMDCHFAHNGTNRAAVILNISLKGALLSSKFAPPAGETITLSFKMPALDQELYLEAKVLRDMNDVWELGSTRKFSVSFKNVNSQLLTLITRIK